MTLFQVRSGSPFPEPIVPPYPGFNPFGSVSSGIDGAMRNDAVWASVRLLADSVSMMPVRTYTMRDGVRVPTSSTPKLLARPVPGITTGEWVYMAMVSLLLRGNFFAQVIEYDRQAYAAQAVPLDPDTVQLIERPGEPLKYRVRGIEVDAADIIHIRAYPVPGSLVGLSPIRYAAGQVMTTMEAARAFGTNFLGAGGHPSSILSTDKPLTQDVAAQIKEKFISSVRNREPAVLSGGVSWSSVQISPEESQFLETQKYGVNQIARIFGVPAEMIGGSGEGSNITYANVESRSMDFLTYSVQPWLSRLETALSALLPGAQHVRFDTSVLVRMDEKTKAEVDKIRLDTGVKVVNDVRQTLDMPPVAWGDKPMATNPQTVLVKSSKETPATETDGTSDDIS